MPNEKPPVGGFKKGHKKVGGRPPGRRNILTDGPFGTWMWDVD